jgi:large subunit ribosomal protein L9
VQVILNQDVAKIGQRGDIVDVSRGYVRNFLVPRGLAEVATPGKLEEARRTMEESEERDRRLAERAEEISGILNKSVITIEARTGEDERLFGSVTAANIADAVERARGIRLDRLQRAGAKIFRNDEDGDVIATIIDQELKVTTIKR